MCWRMYIVIVVFQNGIMRRSYAVLARAASLEPMLIIPIKNAIQLLLDGVFLFEARTATTEAGNPYISRASSELIRIP
jgi:hypothetical protein